MLLASVSWLRSSGAGLGGGEVAFAAREMPVRAAKEGLRMTGKSSEMLRVKGGVVKALANSDLASAELELDAVVRLCAVLLSAGVDFSVIEANASGGGGGGRSAPGGEYATDVGTSDSGRLLWRSSVASYDMREA